jgi:hypothetical protein
MLKSPGLPGLKPPRKVLALGRGPGFPCGKKSVFAVKLAEYGWFGAGRCGIFICIA